MLHTTTHTALEIGNKSIGPFLFTTNAAYFRRTAAIGRTCRYGTLSRHDFACPHTTILQASACNGLHKLNLKQKYTLAASCSVGYCSKAPYTLLDQLFPFSEKKYFCNIIFVGLRSYAHSPHEGRG